MTAWYGGLLALFVLAFAGAVYLEASRVVWSVAAHRVDGVAQEIESFVRAEANDPFGPVSAITALSDQEQKNMGLQAGADDFLTKPVDRRELLLRVRAFLKLRAQDVLIRLQLKKLTDLQAAKDEMLSLMVHDLRSPLSGIVAHLGLLIDQLPAGGDGLYLVKLAAEGHEGGAQVLDREGGGAVFRVRLATKAA